MTTTTPSSRTKKRDSTVKYNVENFESENAVPSISDKTWRRLNFARYFESRGYEVKLSKQSD